MKKVLSEIKLTGVFLKKFLGSPTRVASLVPSSRFLADAMVDEMNLHAGDTVVELGPGTGALTLAIQKQLKEGVHYLGIERDPDFYRILVKRFPHMKFHLGSAEDLASILKQQGLGEPRRIISSLPFVSLNDEVVYKILENVRSVLRADGEFVTFTYLHGMLLPGRFRLRRILNRLFGVFSLGPLVVGNVPPAFVIKAKP